MIRPFTCICLAAALGSGLYLYQTKHRALLLDRDIAHVLAGADAARARIGLLRAEYALQNDPSRLADLAAQWLPELKNTDPRQFSSMAEFERRLPPVGLPPEPVEAETAPEPLVAEAPAAAPEPVRAPVETVRTVSEPARPTVVAAARPVSLAPVSQAPVSLVPSASAAPAVNPPAAMRMAVAPPVPAAPAPIPRPVSRPAPVQVAPVQLAPVQVAAATSRPAPAMTPSYNAPSFNAPSFNGSASGGPAYRAPEPAPRMYTPVASYARPVAPPQAYAPRPVELGNPVGSSLGMARGMTAAPSFFANAADGNR